MAGKTEECLRTIPQKLKIGAYDWTIVLETEGDDLCGQADFAGHRLRLWPKNLNSPSHIVSVAFHESLHVIFDNQGLTSLKRDKEEREEAIVMGFESGLISLFRDNPRFVSWMRKWLR